MAATSLSPIIALWKREILKFVRDRSRLLGALAQPLGFWILLGLGFQGTFQMPVASEIGYMEYLFPGILTLILLFTAVFTSISVVEERQHGFLQAALVAPASRTTLVLGNTLGGTTLALVQALLLFLLLPLLGLPITLPGILLMLSVGFLTALAFTALGFLLAWRMETTRGFHAVMNLFLLPMWFLSGAMFPLEGAAPLLRVVMWVNPVTYAVSALRAATYGITAGPTTLVPLWISLLVCLGFALLMLYLAVVTVRKPLFDDT